MKTVGDFKRAGLVFVEGDVVASHLNGVGGAGAIGALCDDVNAANDSVWTTSKVEEFAWRTNTGVKPWFIGMIEVEYYFNHKDFGTKIIHSDCLGWEQLTAFKKWRPHLPASIQTETPEEKEAFEAMNKSPYDVGAHVSDASKPVYTQAMCDAGELPPVGSEIQIRHKCWSDNKPYDITTVKAVSDEYIIVSTDSCTPGWSEQYYTISSMVFKPIKTEREKAINEITGEWPLACKSTIELMLDAGYVKEKK